MSSEAQRKGNCFVISPIGEEGTETRKRSDQVLTHIIKPAAEDAGYTAERADEIEKPGLITSQVIQRVIGDDLVIADLTETNPNVFYELAIRHATQKPLVQIIQKGEAIPFDVASTRTIFVDHQDLDSAAEAREGIVAQIREAEKHPADLETPISFSQDLMLLKQSDNPENRNIAEMIDELSEIRRGLNKLSNNLESQDIDGVRMLLAKLERQIHDGPLDLARAPGTRLLLQRPVGAHRELTQDAHRHLSPETAMLIAVSPLRDLAPWLYEVGIEAHRQIAYGSPTKGKKAFEDFRKAVDFAVNHPVARDQLGRRKETMYVLESLFDITSDSGFLSKNSA